MAWRSFFTQASQRRGFTLIETLIVIGGISILAAIVLVAINPLRQFAQARNAQRQQDIKQITEAVSQYSVDHRGALPPGIDQNLRMVGTATSGCFVACGQVLAQADLGPSDAASTLAQSLTDHLTIPAAEAALTGSGGSATSGPVFVTADVQPRKVVAGDTMTITATISDAVDVTSVVVHMSDIDTVTLSLTSGTAQSGTWTGSWVVHGTEMKNYLATFVATDVTARTAEQSVPWSDPAASGWVSPTGTQLPGGQWVNPGNAIDGNVVTYASNQYGGTGFGQYIVFTLGSPILSNRVRINTDYLDSVISNVQIDVFASGTWSNVFSGGSEATWNDKYVEIPFTARNVTQARFRYNYAVGGYNFWLYEFQFYQATGSVVPPTCSTQAADLIQDVAATLHGIVSDDGGEPDTYQFQYGPTTAYGTSTGWSAFNVASGDAFNQQLTGLTPSTQYHFQAQVRNSAGTTNCGDQTFTTLAPIVGWVSPSGYIDPSAAWINQMAATDQNTVTYASSYHAINATQWSPYIIYTHTAMISNKLRFFARGPTEVNQAQVDLLVNGVWQNVFDGAFADQTWVEVPYTATSLTQARIRFFAAAANTGFYYQLFEMQFQKSNEGSSDACLDLSGLVPTYIQQIPQDPSYGSQSQTYYAIKATANGRTQMYACGAELQATIANIR